MPVAASAKIGTATPAENGCRRCSKPLAWASAPRRRAAGRGSADRAGCRRRWRARRWRGRRPRRPARAPTAATRGRDDAGTPASRAALRPRGRRPATAAARSAVKRTAIRVMASRSSMTAIDSSRTRTPEGSMVPASASTPSAKAMSVATGIAHAPPSAAAPPDTASATSAGHDHATDRGEHRQRRRAAVRELADHELTLDLHAGDEEEDGQQPVGGPVAERQIEVQPARAERGLGVPERSGRSRSATFAHSSATAVASSRTCRRWSPGAGTPQIPPRLPRRATGPLVGWTGARTRNRAPGSGQQDVSADQASRLTNTQATRRGRSRLVALLTLDTR